MKRKELRTLDSASLDSTVIQRRTQASRESDLADFNLDTNRELLRLAGGKPGDASIAKAMAGKDALQIRRKLAFADLPSVCTMLLDLYDAKDYQTDFKFIDQVVPVQNRATVDLLDALLFEEVKNLIGGKDSDLHLAVPDFLPVGTGSMLSYYGAHLPHKKAEFDELAIGDYLSELKNGNFAAVKTIDDIRSHQVRSQNKDAESPFGTLKVYDCMVHEAIIGNISYVLFDGQWYEISDSYRKEVEDYYVGLLKPAFHTSSTAKNEQALIAELCQPAYPNLLCIDKTKLNPTGVKGANLEACDFLSTSKQLIHLKSAATSAPLNHLWSQGLASAEALKRDSGFRAGFRKVTEKREKDFGRGDFHSQLPTSTKITTSDYTIVFGILKKKGTHSKKLDIPFFSKVALRAIADRLVMMDYKVELHLIEKC